MSLWAGIFVALLTASIAVDQSVRFRLDRLDEAQGQLTAAIAKTKQELLIKVGEVAQDSTIAQHLTWGLAHSVRSTLESHIANGKLDQVTLWTKGGMETGRARDIPVKRPFEPGDAEKALDRWTWVADVETPELLLLRPLMGSNTNLYVAGSVTLGPSWLNLYPDLQKKLGQLDLRIAQASSLGISLVGDTREESAPKLISLRPSDLWLLKMRRTLGPTTLPTIWPTLILAVVCALIALRHKNRQLTNLQQQTSSHIQWCHELGEAPIPAPAPESPNFDAALARRQIERALAKKNSAQQELQEKIHSLRAKIQLLEDDLKRRQKHLLSIAPYHSMAVQIIALIDPFLEQLADFQARSDEATIMLRSRVTQSSQNLSQMMHRWKAEIHARGSRKFIRSLAETTGKEPDFTALDDEIALIETTSVSLHRAGEEAIATLSQLTKRAAALKAHAEQWDVAKDHSLAPQPAAHPLEVLQESQAMLKAMLESQGERVEFQLHPSVDPEPNLPPSPRQVWIAGIFHLLQAFHFYRAETPCKISIRIRQHSDRGLLVLQGRKKDSALNHTSGHGLTPLDLIDLARTLLAPLGGAIQLLPQKDVGVLAIAISWPLATESLKKGDRMAAESLKKGDRMAAGHPTKGLTVESTV